MYTERDSQIYKASREFSSNRDTRIGFCNGAMWSDEHPKEGMVAIDKACDAYCKVCGHYPHSVPTHICRQDCDYYSRFRKYLKE